MLGLFSSRQAGQATCLTSRTHSEFGASKAPHGDLARTRADMLMSGATFFTDCACPARPVQRARAPITAADTIIAAASAMPPVSGRPVTSSNSVVESSGVR